MRFLFAASLLALSAAALAEPPRRDHHKPTKLPPQWEATTWKSTKTVVEMPTVAGRNQVPKMADYLAGELKAAGWADDDIHVLPYTSVRRQRHGGADRALAGGRQRPPSRS